MKKNQLFILVTLITTAIVFAAASYFYKASEKNELNEKATENQSKLIRDHSPSKGSSLLKVTLVEFLDPECESCRMFHPFVKSLLEKHNGNIRYVVRYAPFHHNSKFAVAFLEAARKQNKYWETLDLMFDRQPQWADHHNPEPDLLWTYTKELGLDEKQMRADMESDEIKSIIQIDIEDGQSLGISGTPTFFVNGSPLQQFGMEYLEAAIDAEMKR